MQSLAIVALLGLSLAPVAAHDRVVISDSITAATAWKAMQFPLGLQVEPAFSSPSVDRWESRGMAVSVTDNPRIDCSVEKSERGYTLSATYHQMVPPRCQ